MKVQDRTALFGDVSPQADDEKAGRVEWGPPGLQAAGKGSLHHPSFMKPWRTHYVCSACIVDDFKILRQKKKKKSRRGFP